MAIAVPVINIFAGVWTGPAGAPPTNNAEPPINAGTTFQIKNGGFELKGGLTANGIIDRGALFLSPFVPDFLDRDVDVAMSQNGVIYYDSALKKFRCYEDGMWKDCVGAIVRGEGGERAWGGAKYIDDGTQISCDMLTSLFVGGSINFYAKAENSKIFLRMLRNNANRSGWNFDTGWVNRAEINGVTYQNGYQENELSSRVWAGRLEGFFSVDRDDYLYKCEANWP